MSRRTHPDHPNRFAKSMSSDAPNIADRMSASRNARVAQTSSDSGSTFDSSAPVFSRSMGLPAALGKGTSELKCKVPDVVKDDFSRAAHSLGVSESELLREVAMNWIYGEEEVERMHAQRRAMVSGKGPR